MDEPDFAHDVVYGGESRSTEMLKFVEHQENLVPVTMLDALQDEWRPKEIIAFATGLTHIKNHLETVNYPCIFSWENLL